MQAEPVCVRDPAFAKASTSAEATADRSAGGTPAVRAGAPVSDHFTPIDDWGAVGWYPIAVHYGFWPHERWDRTTWRRERYWRRKAWKRR